MPANSRADLLKQIQDLQGRLDEAQEALRAIRSGEVDAIVASSPEGDRVYTLKGADEPYRVMVQGMSEGALTLTADGLILFSNEQFATILRTPLPNVTGAKILDFVAAEDAAIISSLLQGKLAWKAEVRLIANDLAPIPAYVSAQSLMLDAVECWCVTVTDLSSQKRYEELSAVMESVPAAVFISRDLSCRSGVANRMARDLFGLPSENDPLHATIDSGHGFAWEASRDGRLVPVEELPMQTAARTGAPVYDCEFDVRFANGAYRCLLGNAIPLFDEARRTSGAAGAFVDITDRKRISEELAASNTEFREAVSSLTHAFRAPVQAMVENLESLARENKGELDGAAGRYIDLALAGGSRIESLLKGFVTYSEVTQRGETLTNTDFDRVLAQVLLNLNSEVQQSGITVTSDALPTLVADELALTQVFQNLIANSIRFRSRRNPRIHVSSVRTGERWLFTVRDNGIGIDRGAVESVFSLFRQLDDGGVAGAGIGLTLCRKIIERLGGRIWVESESGHGSAFRFTIPAHLELPVPEVPVL